MYFEIFTQRVVVVVAALIFIVSLSHSHLIFAAAQSFCRAHKIVFFLCFLLCSNYNTYRRILFSTPNTTPERETWRNSKKKNKTRTSREMPTKIQTFKRIEKEQKYISHSSSTHTLSSLSKQQQEIIFV